mmetsp:Transcript_13581/g.37501  ORF Transcript_13581/g.37501 Transcript_13581/m.37501 type:complete len:115 (-) Transcript_13581:2178-2522(-)
MHFLLSKLWLYPVVCHYPYLIVMVEDYWKLVCFLLASDKRCKASTAAFTRHGKRCHFSFVALLRLRNQSTRVAISRGQEQPTWKSLPLVGCQKSYLVPSKNDPLFRSSLALLRF